MDIRGRIRQLIEERGLKVQRVSLDAGLGQTTLRDYLNDEDRGITDKSLLKLADYFELSFSDFLLGTPFQHEEASELWRLMSDEERSGAIAYMRTVIEQRRPRNWRSIFDRPQLHAAEKQDEFTREDPSGTRQPRRS